MQKQYLFFLSIIFTVLIVSFPLCSPLVLLVFPCVFGLMHGEKNTKNIKILLLMNFGITLIVFLNPFFIIQYRLFLLAALYFSVLLSLDFIVVYQLTKIHKGALVFIFLYCVVSRIIISLIPSIFPFYWTLTMHLLPIMNIISRFLLPVFFEGIIIVLAVMVYLFLNKRLKWYSWLQPAAIILCSILLSLMIKAALTRLHQAYSVINARTMGIPLIQVIQNGPSFYVNSRGELNTLAKPYEKVVGVTVKLE